MQEFAAHHLGVFKDAFAVIARGQQTQFIHIQYVGGSAQDAVLGGMRALGRFGDIER